ncbi:MAG: hypothetical protein IKP88_14765 [Lachnospiraceae bacterium]|nr:hypothetical protein [Lachnospiraceae bacterium]
MAVFLSEIKNLNLGTTIKGADGRNIELEARFDNGFLKTDDEQVISLVRTFAKKPMFKIQEVIEEKNQPKPELELPKEDEPKKDGTSAEIIEETAATQIVLNVEEPKKEVQKTEIHKAKTGSKKK